MTEDHTLVATKFGEITPKKPDSSRQTCLAGGCGLMFSMINNGASQPIAMCSDDSPKNLYHLITSYLQSIQPLIKPVASRLLYNGGHDNISCDSSNQ